MAFKIVRNSVSDVVSENSSIDSYVRSFNHHLSCCHFPSSWKSASVVMLPKPLALITLLNVLRILAERLRKFLTSYKARLVSGTFSKGSHYNSQCAWVYSRCASGRTTRLHHIFTLVTFETLVMPFCVIGDLARSR